jgi:hypothetical protein
MDQTNIQRCADNMNKNNNDDDFPKRLNVDKSYDIVSWIKQTVNETPTTSTRKRR